MDNPYFRECTLALKVRISQMVGSLLNEAIPKLLDLLFPAEAPGPVSLVNYPD